jgi:hypothetical protein
MSAVLVHHIDRLYERAVVDAAVVDDGFLADWSETAFESIGGDKELAKAIRRAIRTGRKLARYWAERDPAGLPDWRNGVDEALGGLGWQAQFDLLLAALNRDPDPMVFEEVKARHRSVHFTEWMEDVTFEEWLSDR